MQRRKNHDQAGQVLATAENALALVQNAASRAPVVAWKAALQTVREAIAGDQDLKQQLYSTRLALGVSDLLEEGLCG